MAAICSYVYNLRKKDVVSTIFKRGCIAIELAQRYTRVSIRQINEHKICTKFYKEYVFYIILTAVCPTKLP